MKKEKENLDQVVILRMKKSQKVEMQKKAEKLGLGMSAYVRFLVLKDKE